MSKSSEPDRVGGRFAEEKKRRCTATTRHTGKRCGQSPLAGGDVCRYHGGKLKQATDTRERRLEISQALRDGIPHPAYVFFELMELKWKLSRDGSELTCTIPTAQLGSLQDVRSGLGWVRHWDKVETYLKWRRAQVERKKRVRVQDAEDEAREDVSEGESGSEGERGE